MARIVIDARFVRTTTGRYIDRLSHYLQKIDQTNDYLVLLKPKDIDNWQSSNPRFQKIACPYKEFTFAEQIGLLKQINDLKPDLVHFTMVQQPVLYRGKVVTTMHDLTTIRFRDPSKNWLIFTIKQLVYKRVNKYAARKSKIIIVPSRFVGDDVAQYTGASKDKIVVTYEATEPIAATPEPIPSVKPGEFIMYVGRPQPHKNLERLVKAFSQLQEKHPQLKLVLVGKKDTLYKDLQKQVEQKGIKGIIFAGFVSDGQLRWLYENTAAYIFPSLSEGFGLPALEAMTHGAPVVSSNATCLPEIYGPAAHYFDPLDVAGMATKIDEVLTDQKLRAKLIAAGHQQAAKYSWQRMAAQTLDVYSQVLNF